MEAAWHAFMSLVFIGPKFALWSDPKSVPHLLHVIAFYSLSPMRAFLSQHMTSAVVWPIIGEGAIVVSLLSMSLCD